MIGLKHERGTKNEQPNAQVLLLPRKTLPLGLPCEEPAGKRPSAPVNSPPGRVNQLGTDIPCIPIEIAGRKLTAALDSTANYDFV